MALHLAYFPASPSTNPSGPSQNPLKPIIVLIHGGALSHRMFKDTIPHVTTLGYDIYAPDLPGHGQSKASGVFTFAKSTELLFQAIVTMRKNPKHVGQKIVLVGISLGGQAVLDLLMQHPHCADAVIVAGVSIHSPSETAPWQMPHMPTDQRWLDIMTEDVQIIGMENAQALQAKSFSFEFEPTSGLGLPPILVVVGEKDVAMARRDFDELVEIVKGENQRSEGKVLEGAWHNHSIDIPEVFAGVVDDWVRKVL